jgi:CheY-like chemotaxis protein
MDKDSVILKLLLVDDEDDFRRATSAALGRRGFTVTEAATGVEALHVIRNDRPGIVLLDLKMPGMSGIETLQVIREQDATLPVIILTGHGDYDAAVAGIKLEIVDFLQKPIDMDKLGDRIRGLLEQGIENESLREPTISKLMVSPSLYPRLSVDESAADAVKALQKAFYKSVPEESGPGEVRSALVYSKDDKFLGIIRFHNLLRPLLRPYIGDSPYATFFTGMVLAQCKVLYSARFSQELLFKYREISASCIGYAGFSEMGASESSHLAALGGLFQTAYRIDDRYEVSARYAIADFTTAAIDDARAQAAESAFDPVARDEEIRLGVNVYLTGHSLKLQNDVGRLRRLYSGETRIDYVVRSQFQIAF